MLGFSSSCAAVVLGCFALAAGAASDAAGARMPSGGVIAFASNRDGDTEIYAMSPNGSNVRRLTHSRKYDSPASWSPDGRKLLFYSQRSSVRERVGHERGWQRAAAAHPWTPRTTARATGRRTARVSSSTATAGVRATSTS